MRRFAFAVVVLISTCTEMFAGDRAAIVMRAEVTVATPEQDDATLRAVTCVGRTIWAVGDRGVVWKSPDGGASWVFLTLPQEVGSFSFHSVVFLTDRVGWIAGGTVLPVGGVLQGVVLATKDGGETWQVQPGQGLPYLKHIQFFDLQNGVAAGERSTAYPNGVLQTEDGGLTWQALPSTQTGHWNAAAFVSHQRGILAGDRQTQAAVNQGSIQKAGSGISGLQGYHAASLDARGIAWMAGDGAALVRSANGGVSWESVQANLPAQMEDFTNFRCVTHRHLEVWAGGSPGSVIWYSADAGQTWQPRRTGDAAPLTAMAFADELHGVAVGHLGRISVTQDAGKTWQTVRGTGRRLACLAVQSHADQTALPFLTRWAREDGYRSSVMLATRRDVGQDAHVAEQLDARLAHAVQTAGGNRGWIDWRLPVSLPMLDQNREKLLEEWTLLTDRRLGDVLLASLVGEIRTWRPSVLLIDEPREGEFTAELLQRAIGKAMILAADPTFALNQTEIAGLETWQVRKLVLQRKPGIAGTIRLDPFEILPRQLTTLELASATAIHQLHNGDNTGQSRAEFVISRTVGEPALSERNVFSDLGLAPGGEARRPQTAIRTLELDQLAQQISHRRTVTAVSERIISDPDRAGMLLAQMNDIIGVLSPEQAAQQLATIGGMAHQRGEWGLAESIYSELITRYPDQPPAVEAMVWLMKFWNSAEMNWQRLRTMQASRTQTRINPAGQQVALEAIDLALKQAQKAPLGGATAFAPKTLATGVIHSAEPLSYPVGNVQSVVNAQGNSASPQQMMLTRWQAAAASVSQSLQVAYPHLFEKPEVQFVTASLRRRRGDHRGADEIYGQFMKTLNNDPWCIAARGEAYLLRPGAQSPKPVIICRKVSVAPTLDGLLSDPAWTEATEIRLGEEQGETYVGDRLLRQDATASLGAKPVMFLARDAKFLYFAASVPIDPTLPTDGPDLPGRAHDDDLSGYDRICLQLDVDRDYATYYQFEVDQRGHTRESCWDNQAFNPTWYCAAVRTQDCWRVECAIPLEELLPADRMAGTSWGVGMTRISPARGAQSWTGSGAAVPLPAMFGIVRFE